MVVRNIEIGGKTVFFVADDLGVPVSFGYGSEVKAVEVAELIESSEGNATIPEGIDVDKFISGDFEIVFTASHDWWEIRQSDFEVADDFDSDALDFVQSVFGGDFLGACEESFACTIESVDGHSLLKAGDVVVSDGIGSDKFFVRKK